MRLIFLDTGTLGLISHPKAKPDAEACRRWATDLLSAGARIIVPGIDDYEARRELIRESRTGSLRRLNAIREGYEFAPITQEAIDEAAVLWAKIRDAGLPTADDKALDGDCILAAQALLAAEPGDVLTVASDNVRHLSRFLDARRWEEIAT
jgi:predicted nucleic acid-binding protein